MEGLNRLSSGWRRHQRHFEDLSDAEILALAIRSEEEATQTYMGFAEQLREDYPDSARMFTEMAQEETEHRHRLIDMFKKKFGDTLPPVRASDVRGLILQRP